MERLERSTPSSSLSLSCLGPFKILSKMTVIVGILGLREGLLKVVKQKVAVLYTPAYSVSIQQCSVVGLRSSDLDAY